MPVPEAPFFTVFNKGICLHTEVEIHRRVTRLALICNSDSQCLTYDANGMAWLLHYERPPTRFSFISRVLAHTFYNPVSSVAITWSQLRPYSLDELRKQYLDAVDADDDILTQFVGHDELSSRIRGCSTFRDFVATWEWQTSDPNARSVNEHS